MFVASIVPAKSTAGFGLVNADRSAVKAEFAAWMKTNMDRMKLSQNKLARAVGVSVNTISRYCKADDDAEPKMSIARQIARIFGVALPSLYGDNSSEDDGFFEPAIEPLHIPLEPGEEWNGNISRWVVKNNEMQMAGYLKGDVIRADARLQPVDRDIVVANLYDLEGTARTVLRVFKSPSYLVPASNDTGDIEIQEVGKNAAIFGVVFESVRRRQPNRH